MRGICKKPIIEPVLPLSPQQIEHFRDAVRAASLRADVGDAVRNVYVALADAIELRKPICRTSGRCCRFDEFGHRLFVTTMEMGTFVRELEQMGQCRLSGTDASAGCPFQIDGLCSVHSIRPFGCRIFFCDETATQWQHEQYARFHQELKRLHEELGVRYFYVEWREALRVIEGYNGAR
jgi:Fe-S-cluster containining protein